MSVNVLSHLNHFSTGAEWSMLVLGFAKYSKRSSETQVSYTLKKHHRVFNSRSIQNSCCFDRLRHRGKITCRDPLTIRYTAHAAGVKHGPYVFANHLHILQQNFTHTYSFPCFAFSGRGIVLIKMFTNIIVTFLFQFYNKFEIKKAQ